MLNVAEPRRCLHSTFNIQHSTFDNMAQESPIHEVRPTTQELKIPARFGVEYAAADHISGSGEKSESGDQRMRNVECLMLNVECRGAAALSSFNIQHSTFNI